MSDAADDLIEAQLQRVLATPPRGPDGRPDERVRADAARALHDLQVQRTTRTGRRAARNAARDIQAQGQAAPESDESGTPDDTSEREEDDDATPPPPLSSLQRASADLAAAGGAVLTAMQADESHADVAPSGQDREAGPHVAHSPDDGRHPAPQDTNLTGNLHARPGDVRFAPVRGLEGRLTMDVQSQDAPRPSRVTGVLEEQRQAALERYRAFRDARDTSQEEANDAAQTRARRAQPAVTPMRGTQASEDDEESDNPDDPDRFVRGYRRHGGRMEYAKPRKTHTMWRCRTPCRCSRARSRSWGAWARPARRTPRGRRRLA